MDTTKENALKEISSTREQIDILQGRLNELEESLKKESREPKKGMTLLEAMKYARDNGVGLRVNREGYIDPINIQASGLICLEEANQLSGWLAVGDLELHNWDEVLD